MSITLIITLVGEVAALIGVLAPIIASNRKSKKGQLCLLRKAMLETYYSNREAKTIRQYEYENFFLLFDAYRLQKGNSFVVKIADEVKTWKVIT